MKNRKLLLAFILTILAILGSIMETYKKVKKKIFEKNELNNKILQYYDILNQWLRLKQDGISISEYLTDRKLKTIAIYGIKELGERLYDELKDSDIEVKYIIDKRRNAFHEDVDVINPDELPSNLDAIIVTAVYYFENIEKELKAKVDCPIISIEDIIFTVK